MWTKKQSNFNNKFEHEKSVCQNDPKESAYFYLGNKYQCSNMLYTHQISPHVTVFPKIEKFPQRIPFSVS
jgi:hypothetical protein